MSSRGDHISELVYSVMSCRLLNKPQSRRSHGDFCLLLLPSSGRRLVGLSGAVDQFVGRSQVYCLLRLNQTVGVEAGWTSSYLAVGWVVWGNRSRLDGQTGRLLVGAV